MIDCLSDLNVFVELNFVCFRRACFGFNIGCVLFQNLTNLDRSERNALRSQSNSASDRVNLS